MDPHHFVSSHRPFDSIRRWVGVEETNKHLFRFARTCDMRNADNAPFSQNHSTHGRESKKNTVQPIFRIWEALVFLHFFFLPRHFYSLLDVFFFLLFFLGIGLGPNTEHYFLFFPLFSFPSFQSPPSLLVTRWTTFLSPPADTTHHACTHVRTHTFLTHSHP